MHQPPKPFIVVCVGCQRTLLVVDRIGDPEIDRVHAHLRGCRESAPVGERVSLEEIMRRIHVAAFSRRGPPGPPNC